MGMMRNTVREGDGEMIPVLVAGADIWLKLTGLCQVAESASLIDYPGFLAFPMVTHLMQRWLTPRQKTQMLLFIWMCEVL